MHDIFKERSDPSGSTWKQLKDETKTFYYGEFKKTFEWDATMNSTMEVAWERLTRERYSGYLSRMRKNKRQLWVPMDVWNQWQADWSTKEALAKYEQARINRAEGGEGPTKSTHTGGSVSFKTSAERLEKCMGHRPTLSDVFRDTHTKNCDGENFIDDRSKKINDQLLLLRQQLGLEEEVDDNQLYYKAVGGHDKRKRVFGIRSLALYVPIGDVRCNSTAPSEIQSTPTDYSIQQQLHTLKEHVDHQKKSAEEEKKRMEEALATESQKRIELANRLEEAMTIIATLQGHGTPSSSHASG